MFTTRPEIAGTFGVVASTHWIASQVGMAVLERGGNAFDAAVATAFTLQVAEPHLNGPGGDAPIILHAARTQTQHVICGQGVAPQAATLDKFRALDVDLIPATGLLPAVVPGAFDAWCLLLRDWGTWELPDVLAFAIGYARNGIHLVPRISATIESMRLLFEAEWTSSAAVFLPGGKVPAPESLFARPALAADLQACGCSKPELSAVTCHVVPAADAYCTLHPARETLAAPGLNSSMKSFFSVAPELPPVIGGVNLLIGITRTCVGPTGRV